MFKTLIFTLFAISFAVNAQEAPQQKEAGKNSPITDPEIKTFVDAGISAGLKDLFQGTGPFTFFAPSNDAVAKFGMDKFKKLQEPQNHDSLVDLIIFHIVPGEYTSNALKTMDVKTIGGKDLHVVVKNGEITVNGAKVIHKDIQVPNGVVHVIDTVLVP